MDLPHGDERVKKCLFACVHNSARREYEEFLSDQDGHTWKEMSEEWQQYLREKEESPAV